jgi:hypothetical protein
MCFLLYPRLIDNWLIDKSRPCSPTARKRAGFLNSSLETLAVYERSEQARGLSTSINSKLEMLVEDKPFIIEPKFEIRNACRSAACGNTPLISAAGDHQTYLTSVIFVGATSAHGCQN